MVLTGFDSWFICSPVCSPAQFPVLTLPPEGWTLCPDRSENSPSSQLAHLPARLLATLMRLRQLWNNGVYLHTQSIWIPLVKVFSIIVFVYTYLFTNLSCSESKLFSVIHRCHHLCEIGVWILFWSFISIKCLLGCFIPNRILTVLDVSLVKCDWFCSLTVLKNWDAICSFFFIYFFWQKEIGIWSDTQPASELCLRNNFGLTWNT